MVVVEEGLGVDEHGDDDISLLALDEVIQGDSHREFGFGHVENFILDILYIEATLFHGLQFLDDGAEEHVNDEGIDGSFVVDVEHSPEILNCLRSLLIIHGQDELQEAFVVHLSIHCWVFLEDTVDHDRRKTFRVFG